ncbi:MAG: hypothetical protein EXR05_06490 [Acetobacteraceae bacterium]|nr:hypothetical protein [Acetobacteraceae bacterium]
MIRELGLVAGLCLPLIGTPYAMAQQLDMTRGGPMEITASEGLEWHQNEMQVVARGHARVVRGSVTITADRMIAHYRKKTAAGAASAPAAAPTPAPTAPARSLQPNLLGGGGEGGNEIYRVEAIGQVHIYTATDHCWGDRAVYDMDQAVMLMTGGALKLTTPTQVLTARDSLEYWTQRRMAVARGNAVVVTNDGKRVTADTLVAFTEEDGAARRAEAAPSGAGPAAPGTGKLQRVEAFGHVVITTPTEIVGGDRGIYLADSGKARLGGNVRITRGQNQLNGSDAEVNLNTGVSRLLAGSGGRVAGMVVPNDPASQVPADGTSPTPPARRLAGPRP